MSYRQLINKIKGETERMTVNKNKASGDFGIVEGAMGEEKGALLLSSPPSSSGLIFDMDVAVAAGVFVEVVLVVFFGVVEFRGRLNLGNDFFSVFA